jgi:glycosyltransferase involved in cell wall biosynthesis
MTAGYLEACDGITRRSAVVLAFSCRPHSGSEWGVGWNYLRLLATSFDRVTLYVRDAEQQVALIHAELTQLGIGHVTVVPIADTFFYPLFRKPAIHARFLTAYYCLWLWKAFAILAAERSWRRHNYLFHTTWVSDWIFSPMFLLPFRRKVLGPMSSQPANFNERSPDRQASILRLAVKTTLRWVSPNVVNALRADAAIGVSTRPMTVFPWVLTRHRRVITPVHCEMKWNGTRHLQRQLLFIGKHLPFKNLDLFLAVAAELLTRDEGLQVCLLGDNLRQAGAVDYLREAGLDQHPRVRAEGLVSHERVSEQLGGMCSVLLQASSEAGGTVGVEAISLGAPVVCVRGYGLDTLFDPDPYPLAVPYRHYAQFVADAADMLQQVFADYETHSRMALDLARRFSLQASEDQFKELIDDIDASYAQR